VAVQAAGLVAARAEEQVVPERVLEPVVLEPVVRVQEPVGLTRVSQTRAR
jgi:hypothetical protein